MSYIQEQALQMAPDEVMTVVVPGFIPSRWWHNLLHMQNTTWLRWALHHVPNVVVVDVPHQVE